MGLSAVMPTFHLNSFPIISIPYAIEYCYGNHLVLLLCHVRECIADTAAFAAQNDRFPPPFPPPATPTHNVPSYVMQSRYLARYYTTTQ